MDSNYKRTQLTSKANLLANQLLLENATWKRTLEFIIEEDVNFKIRLSEILKNIYQPDDITLEKIEHLYNRLLKGNEALALIRGEVSDIERQLGRDFCEQPDRLKGIQEKQKELRKNMETAELEFHKLKFDFSNYISEILELNQQT